MGSYWIWLSHTVSEKIPTYGNGEKPCFQQIKSILHGNSCNTARWTFLNHIGTHVDAPKHFFSDAPTITDYPAHFWVFEKPYCIEIDLKEDRKLIGKEQIPLVQIPKSVDLLLVKTGFGAYYGQGCYWENNPGFSPEIADVLRANFPYLRAVGMDFISASSWQHRDVGREAHCAFLNPSAHPILLIEDMDMTSLSGVKLKRVIVAPLRVLEADGSLCTILAEVV